MRTINRRKFIHGLSLLGVGSMITHLGAQNSLLGNAILNSTNTFYLPELSYGYSDLEPFFDKETMQIHHTKHHQAYVNNLNKLMIDENIITNKIETVLLNITNYSLAIRNNAGGHYNHSLFWKLLTHIKSNNFELFEINKVIIEKYNSMENFKIEFEKKAMSIFGSGWCWLIISETNELEIITTQNQDNPIMPIIAKNATPILALDIWEHAYYLKYFNKRADYIKAWWQIINWNYANILFINAKK
jgi:Fe-Mn family superoxide dismutase